MKQAIDLFSGCGGFSLGFMQAGFNIKKAVEYDAEIAKSYVKNHKETLMYNNSIQDIDNENYFSKNEVDIIIGGPPCQGFSMAGARIRNGFIDDERNYLFRHYVNVVKIVRPKIFILENVKGIATIKNGAILNEIKEIFSNKETFDGDSYHIYSKIVNSKDFGVPQSRERMIIIGILNKEINFESELEKCRDEIKTIYPNFFNKVTVKDAIYGLPEESIDGTLKDLKYYSKYQEYLGNIEHKTYNHIKTKHSEKALERIKKIKVDENFESLDEDIKSVHSGSYGRMNYDDVSKTITTRFDTPSGGKFIHPEYDRTLTPREAARIQSFPDNFEFVGSKTSICKQIGNAVPVKLAYFYGKLIGRLIDEYFNE